MERDGDIQIREVEYHGYIKKQYIVLSVESDSVLNSQEISLLDDIIDFVCMKNTAKSISDYSHSLPWEMANMGDEIPYRSAILLFPSQPSPEAFELAKQDFPAIAAARSTDNSVDLRLLGVFRGRLLEAAGQAKSA